MPGQPGDLGGTTPSGGGPGTPLGSGLGTSRSGQGALVQGEPVPGSGAGPPSGGEFQVVRTTGGPGGGTPGTLASSGSSPGALTLAQQPSSVPPPSAPPVSSLGGSPTSPELPPPHWDPFAPPGTMPPPGLSTQPASSSIFPQIQETWNQARKFLETVSVDAVWMPGDGAEELGLTDVELAATFAIPFFQLDWPLYVTPGFAFQFWNGPEGPPAELPPRTYEAFLETAWHPQLSQIVGAELAVRLGVYCDFEEWVEEAIRIQGRGLGVITLAPDMKLKLGVWYLDRNRVKILPAGGLVWTPSPDAKLEALFPNPRLALRLPGYSTVEWWLYLRGEYGGDAWTVDLDQPGYGPHPYQIDYNDIRVGLGVEFTTVRQLTGLVELGGAFGREIVYVEPIGQPAIPAFRPNSTIYIRGAIAY